jgi:hypothetical protein
MSLRSWHVHLSQLIAPGMIFFAVTGAMQIFDLHESHAGYRAPLLLQALGRLHTDQVFMAARSGVDHAAEAPLLVLKIFFCVSALLLSATAGLGIFIGLRSGRRRRTSLVLLALGTLIPVGCVVLVSGSVSR